jgi:hypothetical protein
MLPGRDGVVVAGVASPAVALRRVSRLASSCSGYGDGCNQAEQKSYGGFPRIFAHWLYSSDGSRLSRMRVGRESPATAGVMRR